MRCLCTFVALCMQLEALTHPLPTTHHPPLPTVPNRGEAQPSATTSTIYPGSEDTRAYLLLIGHHAPGISLIQILVTPGQGVTASILCDVAPPPAIIARGRMAGARETAGGAEDDAPTSGVTVPHSLEWHITHGSPAIAPMHGEAHAASSGLAMHGSWLLSAQAAADSVKTQPLQPAQQPQPQQQQPVVVQWVVGFRQGGAALFQWTQPPPQATPQQTQTTGLPTDTSPDGGELLWALNLGFKPVTVAALAPARAPPAAPAAASRPAAPATAGEWPPVVLSSDRTVLATVSPVSNRLVFRNLHVNGSSVSFACGARFPSAVSQQGGGVAPGSAQRSPESIPLIFTVHEDGTWRLSALAELSGCGKVETSAPELNCVRPLPAHNAGWIRTAIDGGMVGTNSVSVGVSEGEDASIGPSPAREVRKAPQRMRPADAWVTAAVAPHRATGTLILTGSCARARPTAAAGADADGWLSDDLDDPTNILGNTFGGELREASLALYVPDTDTLWQLPLDPNVKLKFVITWDCAHKFGPIAPPSVAPVQDGAQGSSVANTSGGLASQAAAGAQSTCTPGTSATPLLSTPPAQPHAGTTGSETEELVVIVYESMGPPGRRVQSSVNVDRFVRRKRTSMDGLNGGAGGGEEAKSGWQGESLASAVLAGRVQAVCAPTPHAVVVSVGRRLACLVPVGDKLVKKG